MELEVETVETLSDETHSPFSYVLAVFSFIFIILSIYLWLFQISAIIYRYVKANTPSIKLILYQLFPLSQLEEGARFERARRYNH